MFTPSNQRATLIDFPPIYAVERSCSWIRDNFLIGEHRVVERMHKPPQNIFELG